MFDGANAYLCEFWCLFFRSAVPSCACLFLATRSSSSPAFLRRHKIGPRLGRGWPAGVTSSLFPRPSGQNGGGSDEEHRREEASRLAPSEGTVPRRGEEAHAVGRSTTRPNLSSSIGSRRISGATLMVFYRSIASRDFAILSNLMIARRWVVGGEKGKSLERPRAMGEPPACSKSTTTLNSWFFLYRSRSHLSIHLVFLWLLMTYASESHDEMYLCIYNVCVYTRGVDFLHAHIHVQAGSPLRPIGKTCTPKLTVGRNSALDVRCIKTRFHKEIKQLR